MWGDVLRNWSPKARKEFVGQPVCGYLSSQPVYGIKLDNVRIEVGPASCPQAACHLGGDISEIKHCIGLQREDPLRNVC